MSDIQQLPNGWEIFTTEKGKKYYFNTVTEITQWNFPLEEAGNPRILPPGWQKKIDPESGYIYYYNKLLQKSSWYYPENSGPLCINIRGLKWSGNSCYLDSTLISLFAVPSAFTDDILTMNLVNKRFDSLVCGKNVNEDLKNRKLVQNQLRIVVNSIRGIGPEVDTCFDLRETLKRCPNSENFHDTEMKDAGEFLSYLLSIFPVQHAVKQSTTYATNSKERNIVMNDIVKTSQITDNKASVIISVSDIILLKQKNNAMPIGTYLYQREDNYPNFFDNNNLFYPENSNNGYIRRITDDRLVDAPYIIFSMTRISPFKSFIKAPVIPTEEIQLDNKKRFSLSAIVLFQNAHYTCLFRCENEWYYYNDMGTDNYYTVKKIGHYDNIFTISPRPNTHGTQYFYTPI